MANYGKIARLPREIRDELNRRLDDGASGTVLLEWLNGIPQVKQVLNQYFEGKDINDVNLSEWRSGGFRKWKMHQEIVSQAQELSIEGKKLAGLSGSELAECLAKVLVVHYAALLNGWDGEWTQESRAKLKVLRSLNREVTRMRRSEQSLERIQLEREWLELGREKTEDGMKKRWAKMCEKGEDKKLRPEDPDEERIYSIRELLFLKEDGTDKPAEHPEKTEKKPEGDDPNRTI